jgi:hypothetical protein
MNTVSVLAAVISVVSAIATVVLGAVFESRRTSARRRARLRYRSVRYREPLLRAASALRTRLGNVDVKQVKEFRDGSDRFRDYALHETLYRMGRYLAVVEIVLDEVHFLDLGGRRHKRELIERLVAVRWAINDRSLGSFLVLGGEQEAIGELFVDTTATTDGPPRCISYPVFRERMDSDPNFARWLKPLRDDLTALLKGRQEPPARLAAVITALDELIHFLDRRKIWKPWSLSESGPTKLVDA